MFNLQCLVRAHGFVGMGQQCGALRNLQACSLTHRRRSLRGRFFSLIGYVAWGHEFFALPMRRRMVLLFRFCCGEKRSFGHSFLLAGNDGFCLPRAFGGGVVVGSGTLT